MYDHMMSSSWEEFKRGNFCSSERESRKEVGEEVIRPPSKTLSSQFESHYMVRAKEIHSDEDGDGTMSADEFLSLYCQDKDSSVESKDPKSDSLSEGTNTSFVTTIGGLIPHGDENCLISQDCVVGGAPPRKHKNKPARFRKRVERNPRVGQGRIVGPFAPKAMVSRTIGTPTSVVQRYRYDEVPTTRFATAAAAGSIAYNLNSMATLFNGGSTAAIPFWQNDYQKYTHYRVVKSKIIVKMCSREAVRSQTIVVVPYQATGGSGTGVPTINNAATFTEAQSLPGAKVVLLAPYVGGSATATITNSITLSKLYGDEALVEEEYAGTGLANPPTLGLWVVAFYNPDSNTVTTGGITANVTLIQTVHLYGVNRTDSITLRDENFPNCVPLKRCSR